MYVALGTKSDGFNGSVGGCGGGWANCLPVRDVTEPYVERDDWARLCDKTLAARGIDSVGDSGRSDGDVFVISFESR